MNTLVSFDQYDDYFHGGVILLQLPDKVRTPNQKNAGSPAQRQKHWGSIPGLHCITLGLQLFELKGSKSPRASGFEGKISRINAPVISYLFVLLVTDQKSFVFPF